MFEISNIVLEPVRAALAARGDLGPIRAVEPVKGGAESRAVRLSTARGRYFLKWRLGGRFAAEAAALERFRATGTVRVPTVLAAADGADDRPGFLLQEWLAPPSREQFLRRTGPDLGARVAALHAAPVAEARASVDPSWHWPSRFAADCLEPAAAACAAAGRMPPERRRALDRLRAGLDGLLGRADGRPSLLHGDLHPGNVLRDAAGQLILIDPHPYVGDREAELAYTEWVGGFPPAFYAAYEAVLPSAPGRAERRDLYLIWFLLRCLARGEVRQGLAVDGLLRWRVGP